MRTFCAVNAPGASGMNESERAACAGAAQRIGRVVHHFQKIDAVEDRLLLDDVAAAFIATEVDHRPTPSSRELRHLPLLRAPHGVLHDDTQRRVFALDLARRRPGSDRRATAAARPEPEIAWRRRARRCSARRPVASGRCRSRAVDALARRGEQHLLDQVADVARRHRSRPCGRARRNEKGNQGSSLAIASHPVTRVCVTTMRAACRSARRSPGCRATAAAARSKSRASRR